MKCKYTSVQCLSGFGTSVECCSFEMAEQYCGENSDTPGENHSEYLRIIDDLSIDLNNLSCQVNMVQSEFLDDELALRFENSLKDLETQNDLLQAAIDSLTAEKDTIERTLKTENEKLKEIVCGLEQKVSLLQSKIDELLRKPCERCEENVRVENHRLHQRQSVHRTSSDEKLEKLENELRWKCRTVETLKSEKDELQKELTEIRRKSAKTKLLQRRESTPDKKLDQEELRSKLNAAQEKNLEQTKTIQKLSKQVTCFQTLIDELRTNEEVYKSERTLLHMELTTLKESQASQIGTQQSLKEQLHRTVSELFSVKEKLSECNQEMQHLENIHRNVTKRFREAYAELVKKHNILTDGYNEASQENQTLLQIIGDKDKILATYDAWKKQQIEIDSEMQKKTQLFEKHIRQMLEDNQKLLDRLSETENDNQILKETLENSRHHLSGNQSSTASGSVRGYRDMDSVSKVIENVRLASRKLTHQRLVLEDEATDLAK